MVQKSGFLIRQLLEGVLDARKLASKHETTMVWVRPEVTEEIFTQPVAQSREVALPMPLRTPVVPVESRPADVPISCERVSPVASRQVGDSGCVV